MLVCDATGLIADVAMLAQHPCRNFAVQIGASPRTCASKSHWLALSEPDGDEPLEMLVWQIELAQIRIWGVLDSSLAVWCNCQT